MVKKIKVTLKKSPIGSSKKQKGTLTGLGLKKVNSTKVLLDTREVRGMVNKVSHLVTLKDVKE